MPVEDPSFSGEYAPNGRSQDDGKDNTADHDHDLLLLTPTRREKARKTVAVRAHDADKKETGTS